MLGDDGRTYIPYPPTLMGCNGGGAEGNRYLMDEKGQVYIAWPLTAVEVWE